MLSYDDLLSTCLLEGKPILEWWKSDHLTAEDFTRNPKISKFQRNRLNTAEFDAFSSSANSVVNVSQKKELIFPGFSFLHSTTSRERQIWNTKNAFTFVDVFPTNVCCVQPFHPSIHWVAFLLNRLLRRPSRRTALDNHIIQLSKSTQLDCIEIKTS